MAGPISRGNADGNWLTKGYGAGPLGSPSFGVVSPAAVRGNGRSDAGGYAMVLEGEKGSRKLIGVLPDSTGEKR